MPPDSHRPETLTTFEELQASLRPMWARIAPDRLLPRTVLVVPSLSLSQEELAKVTGAYHYEERMLCLLMLLRLPRTRVIYITSQAIDPTIVDYYLHLLAGVPASHARPRLELFSCGDGSNIPLTAKLLERPRLLSRIRRAIMYPEFAHLVCFNVTELERALAVQLQLPIYGCDPALQPLGSKSGSREVFRTAGLTVAPGRENLRDADDIAEVLSELRRTVPRIRRAVVKLNHGFSGEGNAIFQYDEADSQTSAAHMRAQLPHRLAFEAPSETWESFERKFEHTRGIVEAFVEGRTKVSPSVQCRIDPLGDPQVISTHDQVLGGPSGQVFLGCTFPADAAYRADLDRMGHRVAKVLMEHGVLGRFGVDFVSVLQEDGSWEHTAIEINLRKGGTTYPFLMLSYLTDGKYDSASGQFFIPDGSVRGYLATDNLESDAYRGLMPQDLIEIAVENDLHFHGASQEGVVFHLLGALSEFGKLGLVAIGGTHERAKELFNRTVAILDRETGASSDVCEDESLLSRRANIATFDGQ